MLSAVLFNLFFTSTNVLCHLLSPSYLHRAPSKWLRALVTKAKTGRDLSLRCCSPTTMPLCDHLLIRKLSTGQYSETSRLFGLTSSLGKKEDLLQPAKKVFPVDCQSCITIDDTQLAMTHLNIWAAPSNALDPLTKKSNSGSRGPRPVEHFSRDSAVALAAQ